MAPKPRVRKSKTEKVSMDAGASKRDREDADGDNNMNSPPPPTMRKKVKAVRIQVDPTRQQPPRAARTRTNDDEMQNSQSPPKSKARTVRTVRTARPAARAAQVFPDAPLSAAKIDALLQELNPQGPFNFIESTSHLTKAKADDLSRSMASMSIKPVFNKAAFPKLVRNPKAVEKLRKLRNYMYEHVELPLRQIIVIVPRIDAVREVLDKPTKYLSNKEANEYLQENAAELLRGFKRVGVDRAFIKEIMQIDDSKYDQLLSIYKKIKAKVDQIYEAEMEPLFAKLTNLEHQRQNYVELDNLTRMKVDNLEKQEKNVDRVINTLDGRTKNVDQNAISEQLEKARKEKALIEAKMREHGDFVEVYEYELEYFEKRKEDLSDLLKEIAADKQKFRAYILEKFEPSVQSIPMSMTLASSSRSHRSTAASSGIYQVLETASYVLGDLKDKFRKISTNAVAQKQSKTATAQQDDLMSLFDGLRM